MTNELLTKTPRFEKAPAAPDAALAKEVAALSAEIRRQGSSIATSRRAFSIFALIGFLLAGLTFLAVAFKLDGTTTPAKTTTPAAPVTPAAAVPAPAAALPHNVTVGLREFVVASSAKVAAAGRVSFAVKNSGSVPHELVVIRTDKSAGTLMKGARADETGNTGETGDLAVGASKTIALNLKPGHYALICNLPGHYQAGQHLDFTVK